MKEKTHSGFNQLQFSDFNNGSDRAKEAIRVYAMAKDLCPNCLLNGVIPDLLYYMIKNTVPDGCVDDTLSLIGKVIEEALKERSESKHIH